MAFYASSDAQRISYIYLSGLRGQFWFPNNGASWKGSAGVWEEVLQGESTGDGKWGHPGGSLVNHCWPGCQHSGAFWALRVSELRFRFPESQAARWQSPSMLSLQIHMSSQRELFLNNLEVLLFLIF